MSFIHLNLHTEYSIVDGLIRIPDLIEKASSCAMPAVAITDLSNLFGMVKWYKAAITAGIKPIIGADLWVNDDLDIQKPYRFILLCQNNIGYLNLIWLISRSFTEGQKGGKPMVSRSWFTRERCKGLIALSGGIQGDVGLALLSEQKNAAEILLKQWNELFPGRFYLEISRIGDPKEELYIELILRLAQQHSIPIVATNQVRFLNSEDFEAHEARICINSGWVLGDAKRPREYRETQYFRSEEEMRELFSDMPEALENTVEIAKRCNLILILGTSFLPKFPAPDNTTPEDYLEALSLAGLNERLHFLFGVQSLDLAEKRKVYDDRLAFELAIIKQMGFSSYFLIVADFVQWAKDRGISVGPGRGSGAGSLVAYALKITDIDPLRFNLLFERFLNPERVSMPDFDIDFCMMGRDRVIDYVMDKYGRDSVSQIITYGTMAARGVVRDVGRILGHPYGFIDQLAKLIPLELGITLEQALNQEEILRERYQKEPEIHHLIDLARKLEGIVRNVGKHAGGVVISPSLLTDFVPLYCESGTHHLISQFDKDDVDAIGLVKFDFLGLRTLTIIDWAVRSINEKRLLNQEQSIDIAHIPLNDSQVFALLQSSRTTAVFQIESRGMTELSKKLKPDCFEDVLALVALYRPGPLQSGMVDDFINRKHGAETIRYLHPALEPILKSTYGVILYQEQVMQIAQVLSGYSLGQADLLRKAMGKKKPEVMAKQRMSFIMGAVEREIHRETAEHVFDLMEKFAGYGFNKAHSAAYAMIAYQTAWLKVYYPEEFMSAVLSSDMDNTDKIVRFIDECHLMKISILSPNINEGFYRFVVRDNKIVYGLGAIKGVGEAAANHIIQVRQEEGIFKSFFDFCKRVDLHKINKRTLEALIKSGSFDCLETNRAALFFSMKHFVQIAEQQQKDSSWGQQNLFETVEGKNEFFVPELLSTDTWEVNTRLDFERDMLGFYFSGHPIDGYTEELKHFITCSIGELRLTESKQVILSGFIVAIRKMTTKRGDQMAFVRFNDGTGAVEIAVFAENYAKYQSLLKKGELLIIECDIQYNRHSDSARVNANQIMLLNEAREKYAKYICVYLEKDEEFAVTVEKLTHLLQQYPGKIPVMIEYQNATAKTHLFLDSQWNVSPSILSVSDIPYHIKLLYDANER